jgi:hypothetical protein
LITSAVSISAATDSVPTAVVLPAAYMFFKHAEATMADLI